MGGRCDPPKGSEMDQGELGSCGRTDAEREVEVGRLSYRVSRLEASLLPSGRCRWLRRYNSLTVVYSSSTR